jgi:hypothetical protein
VGPDIPHWKRVQAANVEYSSMLALSLCCRVVFAIIELALALSKHSFFALIRW